MSALIVGVGACVGAIGDILLEGGFDKIYFRNNNSVAGLDLTSYGQLDMLILVKEFFDERDIQKLFRQAVSVDIPVFLW